MNMKRFLLLLATFALPAFVVACNSGPVVEAPGTPAKSTAKEEDKQWTMQNKNYASTRYSGLDSINTDNIKNLKVAWTFSTGVLHGHEGQPLVFGNTMYVVTPFPNNLIAQMSGFQRNDAYFKTEPGSRVAPKVAF